MGRTVWFNGRLYAESQLPLPRFGRAVQYGDGVFETMRAYGGRLFRFDDHLKRLAGGLRTLRIREDVDGARMLEAAAGLMKENGLSDAALKIIAFRGSGDGPAPKPGTGASVLMTAGPFDYQRKARCEKGISARVVSIRRNYHSPVAFIKSLNYLDNILGRLEASDSGADEALFLTMDGAVAEGSTSNIFIVTGGRLQTPPLSAGILNGITREAVMQIAAGCGVGCREEDVSPEALQGADEAFMTNSLMEIMPLVSVDSQAIGSGRTGPLTADMARRYRSMVDAELSAPARA